MVRVRITHPSLRAVIAGRARSKKIQMWPPFPERERSKAAGTLNSLQVSRKAWESYSHVFLSKSAARNQHVSSGRRGYTPTVSLPKRWFSITASVSGRNFRVFWSTFFRSSGRLLLIAFQSFMAAGTYPDRPSSLAHRRAWTSSLPRNRLRNNVTLFWHALPCPPVTPSRRFGWEADPPAQVAESECSEPPEAAAGGHFLPGDEYFLALETRMEEILNRSRSYRFHRSVTCLRRACAQPLRNGQHRNPPLATGGPPFSPRSSELGAAAF